MPKWRLGVSLIVPEPYQSEIQGLRRALGHRSLDRIPPHITLVPPVNVNVEEIEDALNLLRKQAGSLVPLQLTIGPPSTFMPNAPVIKLDVSGMGLQSLIDFRSKIIQPPLDRLESRPFVPHVTLNDDSSLRQIEAMSEMIGRYAIESVFDSVYLMREYDDRIWREIADLPFAAPLILGRGGIETELTITKMIDPIAAQLLDGRVPKADLVVTARQDNTIVGFAAGTLHGDDAQLLALIVTPNKRNEGIGSHLVKAFLSEASSAGATLAVMALEENQQLEAFFTRFGFKAGILPLGN